MPPSQEKIAAFRAFNEKLSDLKALGWSIIDSDELGSAEPVAIIVMRNGNRIVEGKGATNLAAIEAVAEEVDRLTKADAALTSEMERLRASELALARVLCFVVDEHNTDPDFAAVHRWHREHAPAISAARRNYPSPQLPVPKGEELKLQ